jgi:MFS family permease
MSSRNAAFEAGYIEILRKNRDFRRLWLGQLVSQAGDWFNTVALFLLLLGLTDSVESLAYVLILKLLPAFFVGPLAGVVADRFDRKTIMIAADVLRGILVLGFLFIDRPEHAWLVYLLTGLQVAVAAFFEPAKTASIPNIVRPEGLVAANAISSATWSVTLAVGAALGGFVADAFGRDTAFIVDSISFFVSAVFILLSRIPRRREQGSESARPARRPSIAELTGARDLVAGSRYLRSNLRVVALMLVKAGWGLGGGVLLLLPVFGKQVFPLGREGGASIGVLYAARGIGALIGPLAARTVAGGTARGMRTAIGIAFFVSALFYVLFSLSGDLITASLCVLGAHAGGSIQWVFSTTLLQMTVPDQFRGRVFATELGLVTLTMSLSTYLGAIGLDRFGLDLRTVMLCLGLAFALPGALWLSIQPRLNRSDYCTMPRL